LALIFICRASYQGVTEFFRDILDSSISKGTIHNIVHQHLEIAKQINQQQDLSNVHEGLHDEIYQAGDPVLVGCCARSTYCYLLSLVDRIRTYVTIAGESVFESDALQVSPTLNNQLHS
jgi:hypothetical protein